MKTGISKTQAALAAFRAGEFAKALTLYQDLARTISSRAFEINIKICEHRLAAPAHFPITDSTVRGLQPHTAESNKSALNIEKTGIQNKAAAVAGTYLMESIELTDQMKWYDVKVHQGDEITIRAAVSYFTKDATNRRKAVMVVSANDIHGKEMDFSCGQLAKSRHLQGYFKYVNCNLGTIANLHNFKIPAGAERIRIGVCRFNATATDRIVIDAFEVQIKSKNEATAAFTPPSKLAAEVSILGWPDYPDNGQPYVMGIMDEFTTGCFEQEINLIQPRPDNWYALAEQYRPAFFFIESAWKGNGNSWQYRVADYATKPGHEVAQITQYALQKKIPTVFWNKEDPVHHQKFMCSAQLVDYIFTTDANMCDSYRKHTGNSNVYPLPFAAQPALHKPAPLSGRAARSCFAGSWYGERHAERGQAMRWLLQAANRYGLDIYDRNHGTGAFPFPREYQQGIKGSLPYKELCAEYSRYRVFLNVNSVLDSPTMFSRRVFELMASGTPVVSTYARGIEELFDSDAVWLVHSEEEANHAIHTLLTDDKEWRRRSLAGIREVFSNHTYAHRLNFMLEKMGLDQYIQAEPELLLIARAKTQKELDSLIGTAAKQSYKNFQLVIEIAAPLDALNTPPGVVIVEAPALDSSSIRARAESAKAVGWLSPKASYGAEYLRDLVNAMVYEPEASGWAKALETDAFAYGLSSMIGASIWRPDTFLTHHINECWSNSVSHRKLFCIDSEEFSVQLTSLKLIA
ncbi:MULTISPECIES: CgeB family protein [Pseudomonas]|uniref:Spore protein YkvP/CgeB glycosyl transferase-like domain-containing protein n=1 Tax=Pseudomonas putida (strain DOT-T1E) TaxID=1196325 RepID=I7BXG8_PSEPT|nr:MULTISPECIES: glycosyltransferase [Pseudomonas]AFO48882.1 hypothetical protein T1E_3045 [Pseudomonas putida DOT-T1E]UZM91951.1 glycosyltransferase [Pseudomonas putida DOT-T1E]WPO28746.1 glycosyltransferase [Pseudomonas sp. BO3-4]